MRHYICVPRCELCGESADLYEVLIDDDLACLCAGCVKLTEAFVVVPVVAFQAVEG